VTVDGPPAGGDQLRDEIAELGQEPDDPPLGGEVEVPRVVDALEQQVWRDLQFVGDRLDELGRWRPVGRCATARSNCRAIFSPTTEPIEPPMNSNTKNPTSTGMPPIAAVAAR
jgi:hypothetical protein